MSLLDFQRALSDMTLDPWLAASIRRRGAPILAAYDLTSLERTRLVDVARQPGMSLNCTLARANRFGPIADVFPFTCALLKPQLRGLLDELWRVHRPDNYQLAGEEDAFSGFLEGKIVRGELDHPYVEEIFRYELACWDLVQSLRRASAAEPFRITHFRHDPRILLPALEADQPLPPELPPSHYPVRITLRGDTLEVDADT